MEVSIDTITMKNASFISNGVGTIHIPSKKHWEFEAHCSQRDFDKISQHSWRVAFKGHNKRPYAQTDYYRHRTWSAMDMKVIFTQLGLFISLPVPPGTAYRPSLHPQDQ
jgi:hypothetical protein